MDNTYQMILESAKPPLGPNVGLLPKATASVQYFQNSCAPSIRFYQANPRPVHDLSYLQTSTSIEAVPDNTSIQNVAAQWHAPVMGQFPSRELSAPNELAISYRSEMYMEGFVGRHYPTFAPSTVPQIKLLRPETPNDQPAVSPCSTSGSTSPGGPTTFLCSTSESSSQADDQSSSQECHTLWKKIPRDATVATGSECFVPQILYRPFTEADRRRYLEQVSLSSPIIFVTEGPFEWGIPLEDIREGNMQRLVDKNDLVLRDCGPSVSVRISWPGYPPFKRQISSRNWRKIKGPITKQKLAQFLAKTTNRFIEKMSNRPLADDAEMIWKVGPQYIGVEDLILVSLHHVSKGSWQPQFRLRRDLTC